MTNLNLAKESFEKSLGRYKFFFITKGWGGNEIMASQIITCLLDMGHIVSLDCKDESQIERLHSLVQNEFRKPISTSAEKSDRDSSSRTVIVSPSFLHCILRYPFMSLRKGYWIYTPFWGFEWNDGIPRSIKKFLAKKISSFFSIIGIHNDFFSDIKITDGGNKFVFPNISRSNQQSVVYSPSEPLTLVCPGRIDFEQKQQDKIVRSVEYVIDSNFPRKITLSFFGEGPDHEKLLKISASHEWVNVYPWASLEEIFVNNSILVLGSRFEGLPLVALEAIESGTPVIATKHCGLNKVLPENSIFDIDKSEEFIQSLDWTTRNYRHTAEYAKAKVTGLHTKSELAKSIYEWTTFSDE